jgi:GTP cyclohydrolase II
MNSIHPPVFNLLKIAEADFPTRFGHFRILGFQGSEDGVTEDTVVLQMGHINVPGDIATPDPVLVRIHSQCLTGDVFHSLRCDCREQLEIAIQAVSEEGRGLIIYEQQEGRGIGLLNKLRAYELQDQGADTVEANEQLGFSADMRAYQMPAAILNHLGVKAVRLMSNNPEKIQALESAGITVTERVPIVAGHQKSSENYLRTKRDKMGHLLE